MSKPGKELYVGSLSFDTTEYDLEKLFSVSGTVTSVHLICDNKTGEFKGCGYVRMATEAEAKDAIASLDGAILIDRKITVSIANPQKTKPQGGGYKGKSAGAAMTGGSPSRSSAGSATSGRKATAAKPAAAKASTARPAAAKPAAAKTEFAKHGTSKPSFSKADSSKTGFSKADSPKAGFSKPASSKGGFSKPGAAKTGPSRSGKR
jgi:RNA recognition motif-containing protein